LATGTFAAGAGVMDGKDTKDKAKHAAIYGAVGLAGVHWLDLDAQAL